MTAPMLSAAFKFLFDRASSTLDRRRAEKHDSGEAGEAVTEEASAAGQLESAMNTLAVYKQHNFALKPDDSVLIRNLTTVQAELERIEGSPIDIAAITRAGVVVEVDSGDVEGRVTGLTAGEIASTGHADVRVRTETVKASGEVTGMQIERRLG
ncbi:hypothetical protein [Labedaea rhizosphaerae]|nr:hypothetical protein [Labedaea rhizosphaerae]